MDKLALYHFLHVLSIMLLTGATFYVAANPKKHKKGKMMAITGILSLLALVGGSGLMAVMKYSWGTPWIIVKIVCWLALSALSGMAYRKSKSMVVAGIILAVGVAVYMVYFRPF
ncbi:SirB2 family protein [Puniceicoccaceae bacterium K14]|nr:SirB2 family protein [Puniceicoccaceae bacterium K14]